MSFTNSYKAPDLSVISLDFQMPYDINFSNPIPQTLETARVRVTPFIPSIHGEAFFTAARSNPDLHRYLPISFTTYSELLLFTEQIVRSDPESVLFAIIDKTKPNADQNIKESLAGIIGVTHASMRNRSAEIGPVVILPAFQRTFVATNAIGAVLKYWLDVPSNGGLGFRRIWWTAHPDNTASMRTAERMGLKKEGYLRWTWALPLGSEVGNQVGKERGEAPGRDSALFAICWDDWEGGAREHVMKLIDRV